MGLETGTGIGDLVPTNPLSTDAVSSGDDHIRLIKTVMQSITFFKNIVTFTASGTWTRPTGVRRVLVYCLGGGGGGGGGIVAGYSGGGGGSAASALKWVDVTAIASVTVTIGAGGAAGAIGAAGGAGTNTSFGSHCIAAPGLSGAASYSGGDINAVSASIGDIIFTGQQGHFGIPPQAGNTFGGNGGGAGGYNQATAQPNSGGGGGGGFSAPGVSSAGGAGGTGYAIVFEFGW